MDTDSDSDFSDRPPVIFLWRKGNPDVTATDPDQTLSEDQDYRETMRGIRSYMGWTHIPNMDTAASTSDNNPFAGPKTQPTGKVSVRMPIDEWLCRKMGKLNLTLVEGYPSRSSEADSQTSLFVQTDPKQSGMGSFPTNKRVILDLQRLCLHGIPTRLR